MSDKKRAIVMALLVSLALVGFAAGTATAGGVGADACIPAYSYDSGDTVSTAGDVSTQGCTNDGGGSGCYYGC